MPDSVRPSTGSPGRAMSRRRFLASAATVASATVVAAGCTSRIGPSGTRGFLTRKPVSIRLGERAGTEAQAFDARLPYFAERFPQIKVEREAFSTGMIEALRAMAASNTLPDNVHTYTGDQSYHTLAAGGALRPIDDQIARDRISLSQWFPEMIAIMRLDNHLYGLPFKGQVLGAGFFYNATLFQQRNVPLPTRNWTLDDLVNAAQQLTLRQEGETVQWGYGVATWGGENFNAHLRQWGGDSFSPGGMKATLDSAPVLDALQWYERLFHRERILHPIQDASKAFVDGKVAMIGRTYLSYKSILLTGVGGNFVWDGLMMPRHPATGKRGGMFSGDAHSITRDSKAPDAAFELLKFVTDREFGVALGMQSAGSTTLGGRPDVYADPRILNHSQFTRQMQLAQLDSVKEIKEPYNVPWNLRAPEVYQVRDDATAKITRAEATADAAYLREVNRQVQAVLDLPRP